jgi:hypothetical protein
VEGRESEAASFARHLAPATEYSISAVYWAGWGNCDIMAVHGVSSRGDAKVCHVPCNSALYSLAMLRMRYLMDMALLDRLLKTT